MTAEKIADIAEALEKLGYEIVKMKEKRGLHIRSLKFGTFINIKLGYINPYSKTKADLHEPIKGEE